QLQLRQHAVKAAERGIDSRVNTGQPGLGIFQNMRRTVEFNDGSKPAPALLIQLLFAAQCLQIGQRFALHDIEQQWFELRLYAGMLDQAAINGDMAEIQCYLSDAHECQRLQHQRDDFDVALDVGNAKHLG